MVIDISAELIVASFASVTSLHMQCLSLRGRVLRDNPKK